MLFNIGKIDVFSTQLKCYELECFKANFSLSNDT